MNWNNKYNKLYKVYNNKLIKITKDLNKYKNSNLLYFVNHLQLMRDYFILNLSDEEDISKNINITSITSAIYTYYKYQTCFNEFFEIIDNEAKPKNKLSVDEATNLYQEALDKYWNNFWATIYSYMEAWEDAFNIQ